MEERDESLGLSERDTIAPLHREGSLQVSQLQADAYVHKNTSTDVGTTPRVSSCQFQYCCRSHEAQSAPSASTGVGTSPMLAVICGYDGTRAKGDLKMRRLSEVAVNVVNRWDLGPRYESQHCHCC